MLKEYQILDKIQKRFNGFQKNIIKLKGKFYGMKELFNDLPVLKEIEGVFYAYATLLSEKANITNLRSHFKKSEELEKFAFEIEFISGDSLENILKEKEKLSMEKVFKYSFGIMNGLVEMREAGIWYHRDIRPANVMIDDVGDRAVIIDFGLATEDRFAFSLNNRRYGSSSDKLANDLVSLGQVMYKMVTGNHLFADSKSMELSVYADDLRDSRDEIYADPDKLRFYLDKVDDDIEDEKIRILIKECLTSKNYDYKKIYRKFKECLE
jgi:serine/threonine protein kinase